MSLIHLIFELFKISLLASLYATLFLIFFRLIARFHTQSWFAKSSKNKIKFWFKSGAIISVSLFIWMFTYWGSHGLGDYSRIPIGQGREVEQIDGSWTFISPKNHEFEKYSIYSFAYTKNYCVGLIEKKPVQYFLWNLKTKALCGILWVIEF